MEPGSPPLPAPAASPGWPPSAGPPPVPLPQCPRGRPPRAGGQRSCARSGHLMSAAGPLFGTLKLLPSHLLFYSSDWISKDVGAHL